MATSWKSQQGNGVYALQFETDDKEKYKLVEKVAQMAVDGKTSADVVEVKHEKCKECRDEHRQLAKWLEELKNNREIINRQKAALEKYEQIKTTINEFWDILLKHSIAKRKESPTLEELADGIHELEVNAVKEFSSRIESMLSMHPAQRQYYEKIKKEFIKENENDK